MFDRFPRDPPRVAAHAALAARPQPPDRLSSGSTAIRQRAGTVRGRVPLGHNRLLTGTTPIQVIMPCCDAHGVRRVAGSSRVMLRVLKPEVWASCSAVVPDL